MPIHPLIKLLVSMMSDSQLMDCLIVAHMADRHRLCDVVGDELDRRGVPQEPILVPVPPLQENKLN